MIEKTASVQWDGPGKKGKGQISTETGAQERHPNDFASWFEDGRKGTNSEEILGAAHAARFTMVFSSACDKAGLVTAKVDMPGRFGHSPRGEGFVIDLIALPLGAVVPGIDDARCQEIALAAKHDCPLSKALAAVADIRLQATLEVSAP